MPRVDKKKNIWKVANILIKNPHATEREIAKKVWIGNWTVNRAKKELEQTGAKDPVIAYIVWWAKERLKKINDVLNRFVDESCSKEQLNRSDTALIKDIGKDDLQRITILWWNATDESGWLIISPINYGQETDDTA